MKICVTTKNNNNNNNFNYKVKLIKLEQIKKSNKLFTKN